MAAGFFGHGQSAAEVVADPPSTLEAGGFLDQWVEWTEGLSLMVATKVVAEGALSHRAALLSIWLFIAQRLYSQVRRGVDRLRVEGVRPAMSL